MSIEHAVNHRNRRVQSKFQPLFTQNTNIHDENIRM